MKLQYIKPEISVEQLPCYTILAGVSANGGTPADPLHPQMAKESFSFDAEEDSNEEY